MTFVNRVVLLSPWLFAVGVASTLIGIFLGLTGFDDLARTLIAVGVIVWAVFGNIWYMYQRPSGTE